MFWVILIAIGVIVLLLGALATVMSAVVDLLFAPDREPNSTAQHATLAGLGAAASIAMVVLASVAPAVSWTPIPLWLAAVAVVRNSCPLTETPEQRRAREEVERKQTEQDQRRALARKAVAERKRLDSYTRGGLALLERAHGAVADVRATEAARDGWLGGDEDLDFSTELAHVSEALLQARRIEKVVERTKKIPDPSPEDTALLRDADKTVKTLRAEAKARVRNLDDCLTQAREIDRLLAEERERAKTDEQRAAARRQLAAELFVAEVRPSARQSDVADAIAARARAFKELRHIVDDETLREIEGGGNPVYDAFDRLRRGLGRAGRDAR